jgi:glutamine amidotransferase
VKVGVLDYGVGNLGSVLRALEELRATPLLIDRAIDAHQADVLILPGVGGFAECKQILDKGGWSETIREEALAYKKPLLGICLGMQLLADFGEEGACAGQPTPGLSLIPGRVVGLRSLGCSARIPHVGWNSISVRGDNSLFDGIPDGTDFYFVHSYAFVPESGDDVIAVTDYGLNVTAAVARDNVWGTQFHPEKSSRAGFRLLKNFILGRQC